MGIPVLSDEEYVVFVRHLPELPPREAAAFGLLIYCGLRVGEVVRLNWQNVAPGGVIGGAVYIRTSHGVTNYPRYVEMPGPLKALLRRYLRWFEKKGFPRTPISPVFLTNNRKMRSDERDLQRWLVRYSNEVLGRSCCPKMLRHTYATKLMKVCSIRVVQDLLGHKSLNSTMIYTHPTSQDRLDAVNAAFVRGGEENAD